MERRWLDRLTGLATIVAATSAAVMTALVGYRTLSPNRPSQVQARSTVFENWHSYADTGHRIGPLEPKVTIVEFGDYQCPFCKAAQPHIEAILRRHADDVALVYRHLPLSVHPFAYPAARAAECAGDQGAFWKYHQLLFKDSSWIGAITEAAFMNLASRAGVQDVDQFHSCLESLEPVRSIADDMATAQELGFKGTPMFLVNGEMHVGILDSIFFDDVMRRAKR